MKRFFRLRCLVLLIVAVWLLADAPDVRTAMQSALSLCGRTVIPALFPFLTVSSLLIASGFGEWAEPLFSSLMTSLFRLPGCAGSAMALGLMGGYPVGAATAAQLYRRGALTRDEAQRLLAFCNNSNPAFFLSVLGGIFGSVRTGLWLWLIHLCGALLTGLLFRGKDLPHSTPSAPSSAAPPLPLPILFVRAVKEAAANMVSVCGFVSVFYVIVALFPFAGGRYGTAAAAFLELFSLTSRLCPDRFHLILASAATGWGGVSVLCQTAAILDGTDLHVSLAGKAVHGLLCALLSTLLCGYILT